ncbi:large conductance mechanosensitive channel protein MscL [Nocardia sp. NBC_00881]|uniref:large conductance mechanosensitive channel protein MscL n=1 Tax=Nocardia sp. NBC_00881 TaxID=2975995 RepID=UPI00386928C0|nr:large conductance mechanosensitive channel protein MscL [Nocardia sp. NBC_00881]
MLKGFKEFLFRGNVINLVVSVVIGIAFVAIITAFTNAVINPILAVLYGNDEKHIGFWLVADNPETFVQIGPIITAVLNFLIIAAALYLMLALPATHLKKRFRPDDTTLTDSEVLIQIRDLLTESQTSGGGRHEF